MYKQCREQSESAEKRYKDVVDKLHPSLSLHCAAVRVSSKNKQHETQDNNNCLILCHHFVLPNYDIFERTNNVHVNANRLETGSKLVLLTRVSCACETGGECLVLATMCCIA